MNTAAAEHVSIVMQRVQYMDLRRPNYEQTTVQCAANRVNELPYTGSSLLMLHVLSCGTEKKLHTLWLRRSAW